MTTIEKSPFKFLDSYSKKDASIFFGRDIEIKELYERSFETDIILLYGASGTGKTSLINCGLANLFESTDWLPIWIRRNQDMTKSFHTAINSKLRSNLAAKDSMVEKIKNLYIDYFKPIYLIFDQFEELFIEGRRKEQEVFYEEVRVLLSSNLQCKIILSMREEWLAHLSRFEDIIPDLFNNRQRLEPMSELNIRRVIKGTVVAFDIEMIDVEQMITGIISNVQTKNKTIELSNLQIYLDQLYKNDVQRRGSEDRRICFDQELLDNTKKLEKVLNTFLEDQLTQLEKELREKGATSTGIPFSILLKMVTEEGTKRTLGKQALTDQLCKKEGIRPELISFCLDRFKKLRIIKSIGTN